MNWGLALLFAFIGFVVGRKAGWEFIALGGAVLVVYGVSDSWPSDFVPAGIAYAGAGLVSRFFLKDKEA
jgi:hypothetical protein